MIIVLEFKDQKEIVSYGDSLMSRN